MFSMRALIDSLSCVSVLDVWKEMRNKNLIAVILVSVRSLSLLYLADNRCFSFCTTIFHFSSKEECWGKKISFSFSFYLFFFFKPSSGSVWHRREHSRNQPECASFWIEMKEENTHSYTHVCTLEATTRHAQINRHKHTGKEAQAIWHSLDI